MIPKTHRKLVKGEIIKPGDEYYAKFTHDAQLWHATHSYGKPVGIEHETNLTYRRLRQ